MLLSVVVTIVDGGDVLVRCLSALAAQEGGTPLEVLVPYDASVPGVPALAARFPAFRFLDLGALDTERPTASPAGQHELFDRRRAAGLAAARGDLVAILQDRAAPTADWARTAVDLHGRLPHAVIGGGVRYDGRAPLSRAVFWCDYGRYEPPFAGGPRPYVTDVNVVYKRAALEQTRALWSERYHETTVHWALQRDGAVLWLDPALVVEERRDHLRLGALLRERIGWARLFAYTRAREMRLGRRLILAALTPLLPFVLYARLLGLQRVRGAGIGPALGLAPVLLALLAAWSAGEAAGYLTGRP